MGDYHYLHVQSDTLLLADIFEDFYWNIWTWSCSFLSAPILAWQACFKKAKVKLELLADIDILLMVEKGTRGGICHSIHRHPKTNNKYMNKYDKNKELSNLMFLDANDLYGWEMSQKLPVGGFKWKKRFINLMTILWRNYEEDSNERYIPKVDVEYPKKLLNLHGDLPFLAERKKIKKFNKLVCNITDNEIYVGHIRALKQGLNHGLTLNSILTWIQN